MYGNEEKKQKTNQKITNALIKLCEKKNYYDITIQDICECAGINRSTFYHYYTNKDELLRKIEQKYAQHLRTLTPSLNSFFFNDISSCRSQIRKDLISVLNFHLENKSLTNFLLSPNGDPYFMHNIQNSLQTTLLENLKHNNIKIGTFEKYYVHFFSYGYVSTVWKWLKEQDCSIEDMADYLLQCSIKIPFYSKPFSTL